MSFKKENIGIIGFGNQAKAWALNLRDSGYNPIIILRPNSPSLKLVKKLGLKSYSIQDSETKNLEWLCLLTPDHTHAGFLKDHRDFLAEDAAIILAHGYSVIYQELASINPRWSLLLFAPKAIAAELRLQYETKGKLSGVYSTELSHRPKKDKAFILELATAIGLTSGPFPTTFKHETQADLFSEQSILCSIIPYICLESYNLLRKKGVSKELAYLECWYEVKLIVDTLIKLGPSQFFNLISPNALIGSQKAVRLFFDEGMDKKLKALFADIESGKFNEEILSVNTEKTQKDVAHFWANQELCQVHDQLKQSLYQ